MQFRSGNFILLLGPAKRGNGAHEELEACEPLQRQDAYLVGFASPSEWSRTDVIQTMTATGF